MALDHLQALADYIKGENVSHISVSPRPPFFLNIGLWWNQHCGQILRSEETHSIPLVYTLWILYSGLYRNGNSV